MIESQNQPNVYYVLPGEYVQGKTREGGWYYILPGTAFDGPHEDETDAALTARNWTRYRETKGSPHDTSSS